MHRTSPTSPRACVGSPDTCGPESKRGAAAAPSFGRRFSTFCLPLLEAPPAARGGSPPVGDPGAVVHKDPAVRANAAATSAPARRDSARCTPPASRSRKQMTAASSPVRRGLGGLEPRPPESLTESSAEAHADEMQRCDTAPHTTPLLRPEPEGGAPADVSERIA